MDCLCVGLNQVSMLIDKKKEIHKGIKSGTLRREATYKPSYLRRLPQFKKGE